MEAVKRLSLSGLLRLDAEPILVERLRLLMKTTYWSLLPALVLTGLLVWALKTSANSVAITLWAVAALASKLLYTWHAGYSVRLLASDSLDDASRPTTSKDSKAVAIVWRLMLLYAIDSSAWGALSWIALDPVGTGGNVLVIATTSAVVASAMAALCVVMPVFIIYGVCTLGLMGARLVSMHDPAYDVLALLCILYIVMLSGTARHISKTMLSNIELRFENLDLVEHLRMETEHARHEKQSADRANLAKSQFLAAASHDLRQPMHAQGLFLTALADGQLTPGQRLLLTRALDASQASSDMLNTLLDYSRIESGLITLDVQPVDLQALLYKIENALAPVADYKALIYRSRETGLVAYSDPVLLEAILRNVVANAIHYTEQGGILIACRLHRRQNGAPPELVIEVWDTGIGIAAEDQDAIFLEFHQINNPERDRSKGLGLGLSIVQSLVNTLGHRLTLRSVVGRGSVFKLYLPMATALAKNSVEPMAITRGTDFNMRVLLIDDDRDAREAMQILLQTWGCLCDAAASIEEARVLAKAARPQLLISDYRLRGSTTGIDAIAAIRAVSGHDLTVLLISGDTAPHRLRETESSGISFLHKPVASGQLYQILRNTNDRSRNALSIS